MRDRPPLAVLALAAALACAPHARAGERKHTPTPFYALCVGTHDAKKRTPEQQAAMLKELGYHGMTHLWLKAVPERLKALDEAGLTLFGVYTPVSIDPKKRKYDPRLKQVITLLKGRDTMIWLSIKGLRPSTPEGDPAAVALLREIADMAQPAGLRVAIYPHTGDWTERVEDAVRVVKKVDRKNVGVIFNLCHWLKVDGDETRLEPLLEQAMPHLFAVTLNGADSGLGRRGGWARLIQPLDSGSFDVYGLLKMLRKLGYRGPIGLQCYGIRGDARDHLARSIAAWRTLSARLAAEPK